MSCRSVNMEFADSVQKFRTVCKIRQAFSFLNVCNCCISYHYVKITRTKWLVLG